MPRGARVSKCDPPTPTPPQPADACKVETPPQQRGWRWRWGVEGCTLFELSWLPGFAVDHGIGQLLPLAFAGEEARCLEIHMISLEQTNQMTHTDAAATTTAIKPIIVTRTLTSTNTPANIGPKRCTQ
jgi:hypothetical protein